MILHEILNQSRQGQNDDSREVTEERKQGGTKPITGGNNQLQISLQKVDLHLNKDQIGQGELKNGSNTTQKSGHQENFQSTQVINEQVHHDEPIKYDIKTEDLSHLKAHEKSEEAEITEQTHETNEQIIESDQKPSKTDHKTIEEESRAELVHKSVVSDITGSHTDEFHKESNEITEIVQ